MYLPKHFEETRVEVLHELIHAYPFGTLVTLTAGGLDANHIPFEVDSDPRPFGTLRGHVARANPVWREAAPDAEALVIFQGPDTYISPRWYPTKTETGKVVPTWNYVVVHAQKRKAWRMREQSRRFAKDMLGRYEPIETMRSWPSNELRVGAVREQWPVVRAASNGHGAAALTRAAHALRLDARG
jgi:predicted FMN-binding regulatory protein PaiB